MSTLNVKLMGKKQIDSPSTGKMLSLDVLEALNPLSFILNSDFQVFWVSSTFKKSVPGLKEGADFKNVFEVIRPNGFQELLDLDDSKFFVQLSVKTDEKEFKCTKLNLGANQILLSCNPIINQSAGPAQFNLDVSDFSVHDVMAEFVFLMKANQMAISEANVMVEEQASLLKKIKKSNR